MGRDPKSRLRDEPYTIPLVKRAKPCSTHRMKPTYQVEYSYYQNNTGAGDNGQHRQTLNRDTLAEVLDIARRIQAAIEEKGTEEERQQTMDYFHPYTGHFSWVKVYEVTRKEIEVPCP